MAIKSKRGKSLCGMCGVGTYISSGICVKCAEKLLEQPDRATKAAGLIPAPAVDESVLLEYVQQSFWTQWEKQNIPPYSNTGVHQNLSVNP